MLVVLTACSEDSFIRYQLTPEIKAMLPSLTSARNYRSATDTIQLKELTSGSWYEETDLPSPITTSEVDKVEVERLDYYSYSIPESSVIRYRLISIPDANSTSGSSDQMLVQLIGDGDLIQAELVLSNDDSLRCGSPACRYADTLTIDSVSYFDVYYLADDPMKPNIFINQAEGVVAFRDGQLTTYQRIK